MADDTPPSTAQQYRGHGHGRSHHQQHHHHHHPIPSSPSSSSLPSLPAMRRPRKLRLLVAAAGPRDVSWASTLVVRLCKDSAVETRAIVDDVMPRLSQAVMVLENRGTGQAAASGKATSDDVEFYRQQAFELVDWADMLVLAPLDADGIAKMLAGVADTLLLEVLRGWDSSKKILLVPGMSIHAWRNGLTKKHMSKIHRKWPWIRTMSPILWHWEGGGSAGGDHDLDHKQQQQPPKRVPAWNCFNEMLQIIKNQAELLNLGRDLDFVAAVHGGGLHSLVEDEDDGVMAGEGGAGGVGAGGVEALARKKKKKKQKKKRKKLPPEIWSMILEHVGDWELAQALGIYTTLPMAKGWTLQPSDPGDPTKVFEHELEWTILTGSATAICKKISQSPPGFQELSALATRLIIGFCLVDVLAYLEANRPSLLRSLEGRLVPTTASVWCRVPVLDYWKRSRWFRDKDAYDAEAINGACLHGHVAVLEWWWRSGLQMRYTEEALEQASAHGHVLVLAWWGDVGMQDDTVVLRPGRSLLYAAQHGRVDVLRWWESSGIAVSHCDGVAKMASRWGQVDVLELWRTLKGDDKLVFDSDVLVGPTMHAHIGVLEWWRKFARGLLPGMDGRGQTVEYRTCDIEEALEDSIGNQEQVRAWWKENGLNLGLRNVEWMKTRSL